MNHAKLKTVALSLGILLAYGPVSAQRAQSTAYDSDRKLKLAGVVTRIDWVNPSAFFFINVKDASGTVANWAVEFGAPNALLRRGLRKTDFPVGVEVTVKGYRAKSGAQNVNGTSVTLPDGRSLYTGSSANGLPTE